MPITFLDVDETPISTDTGFQVTFRIENDSAKALEMYWIDRGGQLQLGQTIAPGEQKKQGTLSTHPWLVKSVDDSIQFKFFPSEKGTVSVKDTGPVFVSVVQEPFEDIVRRVPEFSPTIEEVYSGKWSNYWGHGIPDAAKALDLSDTFTPLTETSLNNHKILNLLNVPAAWEAGYKGQGVKVAVLDWGIYPHQEIEVKQSWNVLTNQENTNPLVERLHGLHVASPIAAKFDADKYTSNTPTKDITGVSPEVDLIDIRITDLSGSTDSSIALGIKKAVDLDAKVIQVSWINPSLTVSPLITDAVEYAFGNGALVVWAGGNYSSAVPTGPTLSALTSKSIGVGNFDLNTTLPFQSSNLAGENKFPYFFAPSNGYYPHPQGEDGYVHFTDGGTSFSSPYVAGIAALLYQKHPTASVAEIIEMLTSSTWIPSAGRDATFNEDGHRVIELTALTTTHLESPAVDLLLIPSSSDNFSIESVNGTRRITGTDIQDFNITGVDRIKYSDKYVAYDIQSSAGDAMELIYAMAGETYIADKGIRGLVIQLLDSASDRNEVVKFAATEVLGPNYSNSSLISTVIKNVYDIDGTDQILNLITAMNEANSMTAEDFFWVAAESAVNHANIDIIGLQSAGVEYWV